MPSIKEALVESNPWWKARFEIEFKERSVYKEVQPFLRMPHIIAFTGIRRAGKSTIMHKLIQDSISNGADPRSIVYFSFDEFRETDIREIISEYEKLTSKNFGDNCTMFLDEVQKIQGWENQLKRLYDIYKGRARFIISGSESLFIKKKSEETLAGRIFEFKVNTLSFREFLSFKGFKYDNIEVYSKELLRLFDEFMLSLGFPELISANDPAVVRKYVKGITEKIIYGDIPKIFKVEDPSILESMTNVIMESPGEIINIQEIAQNLGISRHTASNYLQYLESAFLIRKLYNFSRNRRKVEKKLKKYYPEIVSTELLFKDDPLYRSRVFEWLIVKSIDAEFFWRDAYKNEVDIVIPKRTPLPIEVKYGKIDPKGVYVFLSKFKARHGYIISHREEGALESADYKITIVPAYKFLLEKPEQQERKAHA